jgi:hypothetical protein
MIHRTPRTDARSVKQKMAKMFEFHWKNSRRCSIIVTRGTTLGLIPQGASMSLRTTNAGPIPRRSRKSLNRRQCGAHS